MAGWGRSSARTGDFSALVPPQLPVLGLSCIWPTATSVSSCGSSAITAVVKGAWVVDAPCGDNPVLLSSRVRSSQLELLLLDTDEPPETFTGEAEALS